MQSLSTCHCKLLSQKRRDFTHLVSAAWQNVYRHYKQAVGRAWQSLQTFKANALNVKDKPNLSCYTLLFFVILCYFYLYFAISCHTERSEVSINSKCGFAYLRRGFFILNLRCVLNSVDISLTLNMTIWIFCFGYALQSVGSPFCKRLKMTIFHKIALYRVKFAIFG